MPKSAKKRREKAADFSRAKLKLGKGKQAPSNVIDTSFKARSIALPVQSITRETHGSVPTTDRGRTFNDLVNHTKHHNPSTRRDALHSMQHLLHVHAELLESCLPSLVDVCTRLLLDEDAIVRKSLRELFAWLLPRVATDNIFPHASTLLLFATSAQTHIYPEIRLDAVRFLDILLERIPETVTQGWDSGKAGHGARILEGYLGSLNAGMAFNESHGSVQATSTASVMLTPSSKLVVLQSLSCFLQHALAIDAVLSDDAPHTSPFSSWYLRPSFSSQESHAIFDEVLRPRSTTPSPEGPRFGWRLWQKQVDHGGDDDFVGVYPLVTKPNESPILDLTRTLPQSHTTNSSVALTLHLARALRGTLISTFLDFAPSVFGPDGKAPDTDVRLVVTVFNIARSLYSSIVQRTTTLKDLEIVQGDMRTLLNHMAPYFPFTSPLGRAIKTEDAMLEMNLIYCQLVSLLTLSSKQTPASTASTSGNSDDESSVRSVSDYVNKLLKGEPVNGTRLGRALIPNAYLALLPTIWSFLNIAAISASIFQGTLTHAIQTSSKSGLKKLTVEFLGRIVLLGTERTYYGAFRLSRSAEEQDILQEWVNHLPKVLWELNASNLPFAEVILRFLIRLVQRRSKLINDSMLSSLRSRLVPYFCVEHPVRGRILGPFTKLPSDTGLQNLVLDLVATIQTCNGSTSMGTALEDAVQLAVGGSTAQAYWDAIRCP